MQKERRGSRLGLLICLLMGVLVAEWTWVHVDTDRAPQAVARNTKSADPWSGSALAEIQPSGREALPSKRRGAETEPSEMLSIAGEAIDPETPRNSPGSLEGYLYSLDGARKSGHSLTLSGDGFRASARTDRDGKFEFQAVPAGEFTLRTKTRSALFPVAIDAPRPVIVRPAETTFVELFPGERQVFLEILVENRNSPEDSGQGVTLRTVTMTPLNTGVHPTVRGRLRLRCAAEFRAEIARRKSDEETALRPERFEDRHRELEALQAAFRETEEPWCPLHLNGLGAGVYTLRIELGEIELPDGAREPVFYEHRIDLTHGDIHGLKLRMDHQTKIEEAVARARQP